MDIQPDKEICGSCIQWKGKREVDDEGIFHLPASARGKCQRLNKLKPPQGGCDNWTTSQEAEDG